MLRLRLGSAPGQVGQPVGSGMGIRSLGRRLDDGFKQVPANVP